MHIYSSNSSFSGAPYERIGSAWQKLLSQELGGFPLLGVSDQKTQTWATSFIRKMAESGQVAIKSMASNSGVYTLFIEDHAAAIIKVGHQRADVEGFALDMAQFLGLNCMVPLLPVACSNPFFSTEEPTVEELHSRERSKIFLDGVSDESSSSCTEFSDEEGSVSDGEDFPFFRGKTSEKGCLLDEESGSYDAEVASLIGPEGRGRVMGRKCALFTALERFAFERDRFPEPKVVGVIEPYLPEKALSHREFFTAVLFALAIGLRDGKNDGFRDGLFTDVTEIMPSMLTLSAGVDIPATQLPFLSQAHYSIPLQNDELHFFAQLVSEWDLEEIRQFLEQRPVRFADEIAASLDLDEIGLDAGEALVQIESLDGAMTGVGTKRGEPLFSKTQIATCLLRVERIKSTLQTHLVQQRPLSAKGLVSAVDPDYAFQELIGEQQPDSCNGCPPNCVGFQSLLRQPLSDETLLALRQTFRSRMEELGLAHRLLLEPATVCSPSAFSDAGTPRGGYSMRA